MAEKTIKKSSQDFVPIKEIKGGTVVLEDETLVSVLLVKSLNFSLKSYEEQMSIISSFASFLNLLDFSIQICVQSRNLNIEPYIDLLEGRMKNQTNELIKMQTVEYISFIKNFTESVDIMDKNFYIVSSYKPFSAGQIGKNSFLSKILPKKEKKENKLLFEEAKSQLEQRTNLIISGMSRSGITMARLGTEEVLEVLYKMFNPGEQQGYTGAGLENNTSIKK